MAATAVKFPRKIVNHYLQTVRRKIAVDGALLFGSFAWGRPTKHSDVDLVVISPDFAKKKISDRLGWLSRLRDDTACQIAMDVVGLTPQEFATIEKRSAILMEAKQNGKWLYRRK